MSIRTILVVDDSPTERYFLTDILRRHGYEVLNANSGEEGVAKRQE
jgi:twitching motility two-component system response regulator PilH